MITICAIPERFAISGTGSMLSQQACFTSAHVLSLAAIDVPFV